MEPATTIIQKLGGVSAVATIARVHRTRVSNWMRPKASGGTGGTIPQRHILTLLSAARLKGVALTADDFLPVRGPSPAAPAADVGIPCATNDAAASAAPSFSTQEAERLPVGE